MDPAKSLYMCIFAHLDNSSLSRAQPSCSWYPVCRRRSCCHLSYTCSFRRHPSCNQSSWHRHPPSSVLTGACTTLSVAARTWPKTNTWVCNEVDPQQGLGYLARVRPPEEEELFRKKNVALCACVRAKKNKFWCCRSQTKSPTLHPHGVKAGYFFWVMIHFIRQLIG